MSRVVVFILLSSFLSFSQIQTDWTTFADVQFEEKYFEEDEAHYLVPVFGASVLSLDGQEITIKGYVIEIDPSKGFYVLSKYQNSACFFCGGAGPETIVELAYTERQADLRMDKFVTIKGRLKLNNGDIYHCNYILDNPKVIPE